MKVWYLSHPVKPDLRFTLEDNLRDIRRLIKLLHEVDIIAQAPYYASVVAGLPEDDATRAICLNADCRVLRGYDGIILSGHRVSPGMELEQHAARALGLEVLNIVGATDYAIIHLGR